MNTFTINKSRYIASVIIGLIIFIGCNRPPESKQQAQDRIARLIKEYYSHSDQQRYNESLADLNEILMLCKKFPCDTPFIMNIYDSKHFTLMNLGKFNESLEVAMILEELSRHSAEQQKPWYFLKIADSYLGMGEYDKTVEWISRAVLEKGFNKYKIFSEPKYQPLQNDSTFQSLVGIMKGRIGIDLPARDFTVALLNDSTYRLSSQKGKVVLIDFWDVRCAPCIKAMPELRELYSRYHDKGFEIIGISLDTERELLNSFLEKNELPWPVACSYKGWKDELVSLYGLSATPSTWLIDRNGILRFNEIKGDELKTAIESPL